MPLFILGKVVSESSSGIGILKPPRRAHYNKLADPGDPGSRYPRWLGILFCIASHRIAFKKITFSLHFSPLPSYSFPSFTFHSLCFPSLPVPCITQTLLFALSQDSWGSQVTLISVAQWSSAWEEF